MSTPNDNKRQQLISKLKELFQLDQPDLDFGLYRIMHAKSAEITQFLEKDLLPQVQAAFALYKTADKAEIEKELAKVIAGIEAAGMDPSQSPKVKELQAKLQSEAVDVGGLEGEVYDHLLSFFRRYYSEGDFLSRRVYKPGVYAIPYEGEEVKLHWANADQYYIKTSEYLHDYAFRLRPEDSKSPKRVHFRLIDAAEGEHGNVKAAEGKDRVFALAEAGATGRDFVTEEEGKDGKELIFRFEYRPATLADWPDEGREGRAKPPAQKDLTTLAVRCILSLRDASLANWIEELGKAHILASGERADYSRIEAHLRRYTARSTFDYFIHKDLGGFLRRELDFYIKNEVMHLDDVEDESVSRVEQYLSKIKIVRKIAAKVIDFLAQLENFQRTLWTKKKFAIETNYCVTIDRVPRALYAEIAGNDAQRLEWVSEFKIERIKGDLTRPGYSVPLTQEFLESCPTLVIDTRHFGRSFVEKLVSQLGADVLNRNVLIHGENEAALRLLSNCCGSMKTIYIDPPYNTGDDGFLYRDNYQHSSWCCLLSERLLLARAMLSNDGYIAISIGQEELGTLQFLCDDIFGRRNRLPLITVKRGSVTGHKVVNPGVVNIAEYVVCYAKDRSSWSGNDVYAERERDDRYSTFIANRDEAPEKWRFITLLDAFAADRKIEKSKLRTLLGEKFEEEISTFVAKNAESVVQPVTVSRAGVGADFLKAVEQSELAPQKVLVHRRDALPDAFLLGGKKIIFYKDKLVSVGNRKITAERASDIWIDVLPNDLHNEGGVELPKGKKPEALISRLVAMGSNQDDAVLDFFAGSGTLPATAHKMGRQWIGVEAASYFDEKPLRRMKQVLFGEGRGISSDFGWKGGGAFKYVRLESYEDSLRNLVVARTQQQQDLLSSADVKGPGGLSEEYFLRYMLKVETQGSPSLLNVSAFTDPTAYKISTKRPGSDESIEGCVDLLETFNWLLGLQVQHIDAPTSIAAKFIREGEGRLAVDGRLKQDPKGPWWFRTVTGTLPDGRKTLVVWRKLTGKPEEDNLVLDEWFTRQGYSSKDSEFDLIFVNGGNNLENLKAPDDTWKVRLIEEDFHRLMFAAEGQ